jgi:hypothetical protein
MVFVELAQSLIERLKADRRANLENRNFHRLRSQCTKPLTELACLVHGSGNQDAPAR